MRGVIKFLLGFILILGIAWFGLWWYAEGRMQTGITGWADQLATQGWKISYDKLTRGTSPSTASLTLTNLTLSPPPDAQGRTATITLPTLTLRINALDPLTLHEDLPNRIAFNLGGSIDAAVTFSAVALTQQLDPNVLFNSAAYPYTGAAFAASGIDILASQGSLLVLHIDAVASQATVNQAAGANAQALSLTQSFDGIAVSPLMTHILSIPFGGRITHLALAANISGPVPPGLAGLSTQIRALPVGDTEAQQKLLVPVVHNWAAAGGNGNFTLSGIVGPATIGTDGALKFDANLQPEGTADLTADHLDAFFAALTNAYPALQDHVTQIIAQLSPYITATPQSGQTLGMHVTYGNGAITINGQKTAPLPPIDWTTAENPPAAGAGQ